MSFMPYARHTFMAFGALGLALVLPARASAQGSANILMESSLGSCGNPDVGLPSGTPTSMAWVQTYSHGGCDLHASGFAYLGVVGAIAHASWATGDAASGGIRAVGSGSWTETIDPRLDSRYLNQLGGRTLSFDYIVGAHGGTTTTSANPTAGGGNASIGYKVSIAGQTFDGFQSSSTYARDSTTGEWAGVTHHIDLQAGNIFTSPWFFSPFTLTLSGFADASVSKSSNPGLFSSTSADAEFGSTLLWMGISDVHLYDGSGTEIVMGSDANFGLIGQTTGFDYQEAAVEVVTATPEPSSMLLVGTGVLLFGVARRRSLARQSAHQ